MEEEIWKPCYETDDYEVSSEGRVRNVRSGRVLKTHIDGRGRERIIIYINGMQRHRLVHKLVAEAFMEESLNNKDIFHDDGNKLNNRIDNLIVGDRADSINNARVHGRYESRRQKGLIVVETGKTYKSIKECSDDIGINQSSISKCLNYDFYGNKKGLHFKQAD